MSVPVQVGVDRLRRPDRERIEAIVASAVPSVARAISIAVWRSGSPLLEAAFGWSGPESEGRSVDTGTIFDLASVTKLFTAATLLGLIHEARVGLDDPVCQVVAGFGEGGPRRVDGGQDALSRRLLATPSDRQHATVDPTEVTFRQLLSHTSGMAPWRSVFEAAGPIPPAPGDADPVPIEERRTAGLAAVYGYPFVSRPGEECHYSDLGFMVLGEAAARLAARPLDEAIRARVTRPLGLASVRYLPASDGWPRLRIAPTTRDDDWRQRRCWGEVEDENAAALGGVAGHAGLFGSAGDVAAFGQAWLARDPRLGIGATTLEEATTDQTGGLRGSRGLGWQLRGPGAGYLEPFSVEAYGHTGFTGTSLAVDPSRELVVALLTNRTYAGRMNPGIDELRVELHAACAEEADRRPRSGEPV